MLQHAQEVRSPRIAPEERPLAVCLVSEEYPPETWGGIGTYTRDLAQALVGLGHHVHVITRTWLDEVTDQDDGIVVHRVNLPEPSWRFGTRLINEKFHELRHIVAWNRCVHAALNRLIEKESIDVIECPEYHAQALLNSLVRADIPLIVRLHTPAFLCRQINGVAIGGCKLDTRISENLEFRLARRAHAITAPSRAIAMDVARQWRLDVDRIRVIPNPLGIAIPEADSDRTQRDEHTIVFAGRIERRKGVETLARAMPMVLAHHAGAHLKFVGHDHPSGPDGGSMISHLQQLFATSNVPSRAFEFAGAMSHQQVLDQFARAAVCVVPSLYESFGYTCVEAMATGAAVVVSSGGALAEIIRDGHDGLIVPVDDPTALAEAIVRLLSNPSLRQTLGKQAQQTVRERYGSEAVARQMVATYRSVIK